MGPEFVHLEPGRTKVSLKVKDQNEINAIVDALRKHDIDIVGLSRRKKTLEDFFLDVVNQNQKVYQA